MSRLTPVRAALAAACLLAPAAGAAAFHLTLRRAEPAMNGTVKVAPQTLRLWFTQRTELAVTAVKLVAPSGTAVPTGALARADSATAPIVVPVQGAMSPGAYRVEWRTMAKDGHVQKGTYTFRLAP